MKGFIQIRDIRGETYYINVSQIKYIHRPELARTELEVQLGKNYVQIYLDHQEIILVDKSVEQIQELINRSFED